MFHFHSDPYRDVPKVIQSKLMSVMTNKLKFVVCSRYSFTSGVLSVPETLVAYGSWFKVLEILNKRWQTLDLKSLMLELQRSRSRILITKDTLSSVHRFKRKEDASLS